MQFRTPYERYERALTNTTSGLRELSEHAVAKLNDVWAHVAVLPLMSTSPFFTPSTSISHTTFLGAEDLSSLVCMVEISMLLDLLASRTRRTG